MLGGCEGCKQVAGEVWSTTNNTWALAQCWLRISRGGDEHCTIDPLGVWEHFALLRLCVWCLLMTYVQCRIWYGHVLCASLVQWLKYSKKEYCELCKHRYIFTPSKYYFNCLLLFVIFHIFAGESCAVFLAFTCILAFVVFLHSLVLGCECCYSPLRVKIALCSFCELCSVV